MQYRKRPVVIDAVQFLDTHDGVAEVLSFYPGIAGPFAEAGHHRFEIVTLEGKMRVGPGDWVVRGVKGEYYPVKPDIFDQTYEPVEQPKEEEPDAD